MPMPSIGLLSSSSTPGERVWCLSMILAKVPFAFKKVPFIFDYDYVKMCFGKGNERTVTYHEFLSSCMTSTRSTPSKRTFQAHNIQGSDFISALDFADIMMSTKSHLLTQHVQDNLVAAASGQKVSYPFFMAFNSLLTNMELVKRIYLIATQGSRTLEFTKEEFLHSSQMMSQITPLEVEILYQFTELISQAGGSIIYSDLEVLTHEQYFNLLLHEFFF